MFRELKRELNRLSRGVQVPVQIPLDEKSYMDRECPASNCEAEFKVYYEDWRDIVSDAAAHCPICGTSAESTAWNTREQVAYLEREVQRYLVKSVGSAFSRNARSYNRKPQGGFIQTSLSAKPGRMPIKIPLSAAEQLRQDFTCTSCQCRYSTIGAAFFCPACRHNSPVADFDASIKTINDTLDALPAIAKTLSDELDADAAKNAERQFIENAVEDLATVLQRVCGSLFAELPNESSFNRDANLFQRLDQASNLWRQASGTGYDDILTPADWAALKRMMQQRHMFGHKQGIVDQQYIDRSGDSTYVPGQRLVVNPWEVRNVTQIVSDLVEGLRRLVP